MKILNNNIRTYKWYVIPQILLATLFMYGVLFTLGRSSESDLLSAIGASSLASSTLIVFFLPNFRTAQARRVIGGYAVGILSGVIWHALVPFISQEFTAGSLFYGYEVSGALAVAVTLFIMIVFNFEHPPAVGFSLGLVLEHWNSYILATVFTAAVIMSLMRHILRDKLVNML